MPATIGPPVVTLPMPNTKPPEAEAATAAVVAHVIVSVVAVDDPLFNAHVD